MIFSFQHESEETRSCNSLGQAKDGDSWMCLLQGESQFSLGGCSFLGWFFGAISVSHATVVLSRMLKNSCWFGWEEMPLPVELQGEQTLWFYRFVLLMLFLFINKRRNRLCLKLPRTWALRCWIYVDKHVSRDGARAVSPLHKAKLKLSFTCSTSLGPGWGCS